MSEPVFVGIDRADPESECTVYRAVVSANDWDAPYCAIQDMLDVLERRMDGVLSDADMTTQHRCSAILQKNDAFMTVRMRLENLIRVDPLNPTGPFYRRGRIADE
nr:hypothetical protein [uncultured Cohaesibacter sp.]